MNIRAYGKTTRWKAMASLSGPTVVNTKVTTSTIRRRVKELSIGRMGANMMASGKMASNTVLASTLPLLVRRRKGSGRKESAPHGSEIIKRWGGIGRRQGKRVRLPARTLHAQFDRTRKLKF